MNEEGLALSTASEHEILVQYGRLSLHSHTHSARIKEWTCNV